MTAVSPAVVAGDPPRRHRWTSWRRVIPGSLSHEFEEFERRGLRTLLGAVVRTRVVLLVAVAGLSAWVGYVDPAPWRRVVLAGLVSALAVVDVGTRHRFVRRGFEPGSVRINLGAMVAIQTTLVFATGGLQSPLVPVMLPPAFGTGILLGLRGVRALVLGIQVPAIVAFAVVQLTGTLPTLVPELFRSAGGPAPASVLVLAVAMSLMLVVFGGLGAHIRRVTQLHLASVARAQDSALASHRQRVAELTTLGAEIAHELKNPLASVKGLAQLLARSSATGDSKSAQRLEVLQREIDRMQTILEEFLNFSRPLTPLDPAQVEVGALCRDVVTLHEAMAAERGVDLNWQVEDGLRVRGDARKITQVLINLLQNALEVAPAGTEVGLAARRQGRGVRFEVCDRGPGLDPGLRARMFEPGVTNKESGSGLGLTVARAIATQHGGSLGLEDVPGGGCCAVLELPGSEPSR